MDITVTFRHMEHSDALEAYAKDKVSRLSRYLESILDAHVILSVEKNRHTAEVTMNASGMTINGKETKEDMYSAIDLVTEKMEKQVKKYKQKVHRKKPLHKTAPTEALPGALTDEYAGDSREPLIIKVEDYAVKPMTLTEAAMQINLLKNEFLVFTNAGTKKVNVIYKRRDGNFGLIEPTV